MGLLLRGYVRREALRRYFSPPLPTGPVLGPAGFRHVRRHRLAARPVLGSTALAGLTAAVALLLACTFATAGYHQPRFAALGTTFSLEVPQRGCPSGLLLALGVGGAVVAGPSAGGLLLGISRRDLDLAGSVRGSRSRTVSRSVATAPHSVPWAHHHPHPLE